MPPSPIPEPRRCALVPAFQEAGRIGGVVRRIRAHLDPVLVVDDGSTDGTAAEAEAAGATVLRLTRNQGKGVALNTGFSYAREHGIEVVVTLDADGQHDPDDIPRFLEAYERTGIPVLIGNRMGAPRGMPRIRRWTNRIMSGFLSRAMRQYVPDSQCGFRLYRCDVLPFIEPRARRYAAESEILLHIAARGIRMDSVPIAVIYRDENSKINPFRDTVQFLLMLHRYYRSRRRAASRTARPDAPGAPPARRTESRP